MDPAAGSADVVDVWLIDTRVPAAVRDEYRALLDPQESRRCADIGALDVARRFAVTHGVMRRVVARRLGVPDPRRLRWAYGPNGKPAVAGAALQVNLSHSGELGMLAVTASRPVGVDLQEVLLRLNVVDMAARFYPAQEAHLVAGPGGRERFAALWARKEALVKAAGGRLLPGLVVPVEGPSPVPVTHGGAYLVADVDAPPGYRAAVALAGGAPFTVRTQTWTAY